MAAVIQNPDLDSISAFTQSGGTVTATVSFTAVYAPSYVTNTNTYVVGKKIYITGAATAANNGLFVITGVTGAGTAAGTISYTNASGVTATNQFALSSPFPGSVIMEKGLTAPLTLTLAEPFEYVFDTTGTWNLPPVYGPPTFFGTSGSASGAQPITSDAIGSTDTTLVLNFRSLSFYVPPVPPFFPGFGTPPNITGVSVSYPPHYLGNLYPYKFNVSLTPHAYPTSSTDDGSSYITFDANAIRLNVFSSYLVRRPGPATFDSVNGVIYMIDTTDNLIRKVVLSTGAESIVAGGGFNSGATFGPLLSLSNLKGLAVDSVRQILYVSYGFILIQAINLTTLQSTLIRNATGVASNIVLNAAGTVLYAPRVSSGGFDAINTTTGTIISSYTGLSGNSPVYDLALDEANNLMYYVDGSFTYVVNLSTGVSSAVNVAFGFTGHTVIEFLAAPGAAQGILCIVAPGINKLCLYNVATAVSTLIGSGVPGNADGTGTAASFRTPSGAAYNPTSNMVYISDQFNNTIRRLNVATNAVTTDVVGTIPAGSTGLNVGGTTYIYNTPPTIVCAPGADSASYTLSVNGSPPFTFPSEFRTSEGLPGIRVLLSYNGLNVGANVLTISYTSPVQISSGEHPAPEQGIVNSTTDPSSALVPYISQSGTSSVFSSETGFLTVPSPATQTYSFTLTSPSTGFVVDSATSTVTVTPIPITVTPVLTSPLTIYQYQPFSYVFTLPSQVEGVILDGSTSASSLLPYVSNSASNTVLTFASTSPRTLASGALTVNARLSAGSGVLGSNVSLVTVAPVGIVVTPPTPSGTPLDLYKYEPFSYVFSITSGTLTTLTLRYTTSSSQLQVYMTPSSGGTVVTFAGTPPASYATTFNLVIELMDGTTVVAVVSYPVTISPARLILTPPSPYLLNQFENISNTLGSIITMTGSNNPTTIVSSPGLPVGLSISNTSIVGTPQIQQAQRNYQLIGSNSSTGNISTATISISVGIPVVRILPPAASFSNLTASSTPTATFTALVPQTIYSSGFQYLVPNTLPSGLVFTDINGIVKPNGFFFTPTDSNKTIKLAGSPDLTDAFGFPASGLVNVVLTGYYTNFGTNVQTIGSSTLSFQFAETVLMTTTVSSNLFVGKALGSNDVVITAASYFPATSLITAFDLTATPPGLTLSNVSPTRWILTGTPTTAGTTSYTATATNANEITNSVPLVVTINPDIVTFTQTPGAQSYVVSRPLDSNAFQIQASATSGSNVTYASSFEFSNIGLTFNTITGTLNGTPTSNLAGPVIFTATDTLGASNTTSISFTIAQDVFTWPSYAPTYFQNRVITPFQFNVTTLSGRAINSFVPVSLPPGLSLTSSGLLSGTFTGATNGTFTIEATTGYQPPATTATQTYSYTAIADNLLIVQVNGVDTIGTVFSNVQYRTLQYSSDAYANPVYSVAYISPATSPEPILNITQTGFLSGDFTGVAVFPSYIAAITATYQGVTATRTIIFQSNTVFIPSGFLDFTQPVESNAVIYQYVPYTFPLQATGSTDFIYYFAEGVPIGFTFTLDPTGTFATLSGNSPINRSATVTLYAKTALIPATRRTFTLNTVVPFVINQQIGAAAYTAILREHVEADAAQNARDTRVFPEVNPLAGPFMAPRAPDVTTDSNCPKCEPPTGPPLVPPTQAVGYTEAPSGPAPNTGVVTTLAGSGVLGYADGIGTEAMFDTPRGVAIAPDGTVVVADSGNSRIRRITPEGVVTTIAGSGAFGYADGIGTAAIFAGPGGVAVRPDGIIVVADTDNNRIRLITPAGVVTTLAGSTYGYADGIGAAARFGYPTNVALLPNGTIVVSDLENNRIRLVDFTTGAVTTLAGSTAGYEDGTGAAAKFNQPFGVTVLPNGLIAVGDSINYRIRLVSLAGVVTTLAGGLTGGVGGFADGTGSVARFNTPYGIAVLPTSSLIAVTDIFNRRIRLVSPTGIVTTFAGADPGFADGVGTAAKFSNPSSVAVVPSSGALVVADQGNNRIRLVAGAF
jgi:hypothetical protein